MIFNEVKVWRIIVCAVFELYKIKNKTHFCDSSCNHVYNFINILLSDGYTRSRVVSNLDIDNRVKWVHSEEEPTN